MDDDFNFDEDSFGDFDQGIDDSAFSGFEEATDSDTSNFDTSNQEDGELDNKSIIKTSIIMIAVGIVVITIGFMAMRLLQKKITSKANEPVQQTQTVEKQPNVNSEVRQSVIKETSDWKEFTSKNTKVVFNEEYIDCIFTITNVKNYVKVISSESNLVMKTVVTGNISGFNGTYELEIPYSKGSQLLIGNTFSVKVELGKYDDKVVVGEIKY